MPVATASVVHAAASAMRDAGVAILIDTDYGPVVTVPALAVDSSGSYRSSQGERVMSASWTSRPRTCSGRSADSCSPSGRS
jgi:hypothetical protein